MKAQEIRQKKSAELVKLLPPLYEQLREYNFQASVRKLKNPHVIKQTKKEIARILTILIEKSNSNE